MKRRWLTPLLIPVSFVITFIVKNNTAYAEYYALNIYPFFVNSLGALTWKMRFSAAEAIIILFAAAMIILTGGAIEKSVKYKTWDHMKKYAFILISFISVIYFLFVLFCGINYYRYEFTRYSGLEVRKSSKEELIDLCQLLIDDANEYRARLNTNEGTASLLDQSHYDTAKRAGNSMDKLSKEYKILKGNFSLPKPVKQSEFMSYLNITGFFFPFTFEANVNVNIPPYQLPSVMLHELVHLRGFMREDEANFIAYLASIKSGYDDFCYSGTMSALVYSMNALYSTDYDEFVRLYHMYSDDVRKDMEFARNYWKKFDTGLADAADRVNDLYLKSNNQDDGVRSYGRMVDLLLAYYRK